jgi:hypothetical protein
MRKIINGDRIAHFKAVFFVLIGCGTTTQQMTTLMETIGTARTFPSFPWTRLSHLLVLGIAASQLAE